MSAASKKRRAKRRKSLQRQPRRFRCHIETSRTPWIGERLMLAAVGEAGR